MNRKRGMSRSKKRVPFYICLLLVLIIMIRLREGGAHRFTKFNPGFLEMSLAEKEFYYALESCGDVPEHP